MRLMTLAVLAVWATGCKRSPTLPEQVPYELEVAFTESGQFLRDHPARGGTLYRGSQRLGAVDTSDFRDRVKFTLPATELPSKWAPLELGLPTPCGEKRVRLSPLGGSATDEIAWLAAQLSLGQGKVQLAITAPAREVTNRQQLTIYREGATSSVVVGKYAVPDAAEVVVLHEPDCEADVPVLVDGQKIASLEHDREGFLLLKPTACYSVTLLGYGAESGRAQVVKAPWYARGHIDFFNRPPDATAKVASTTGYTYRLSVQNTTCP